MGHLLLLMLACLGVCHAQCSFFGMSSICAKHPPPAVGANPKALCSNLCVQEMDKCAHDKSLSHYLGKTQIDSMKQMAEKCEAYTRAAISGAMNSAGGKAGDGKCNLLAISRYAQQEQRDM